MGRQKKSRIQPSEEGLAYAKVAAVKYVKLRKSCMDFEQRHPSLLQRGKVRASAFEELECLSEDTFVMPDLASCDAPQMERYLADREKVYLFEYGMHRLEDTIRPIAESLFIKKLSWKEIMRMQNVSRMTVARYRNESLRQIAFIVDSYMEWKARVLFDEKRDKKSK